MSDQFYVPRYNYFYTLECGPRDSAPNAWRAVWWEQDAAGNNGEEYVATVYGADEHQAEAQLMAKMRKIRDGERAASEEYGERRPRTSGYWIAPWGDTYSGSDLENGYVPLEARYVEYEAE